MQLVETFEIKIWKAQSASPILNYFVMETVIIWYDNSDYEMSTKTWLIKFYLNLLFLLQKMLQKYIYIDHNYIQKV